RHVELVFPSRQHSGELHRRLYTTDRQVQLRGIGQRRRAAEDLAGGNRRRRRSEARAEQQDHLARRSWPGRGAAAKIADGRNIDSVGMHGSRVLPLDREESRCILYQVGGGGGRTKSV